MPSQLSESERFPQLTPAGREFLHAMRQHERAPIWNWPNGEQLDGEGLARVQEFAKLGREPCVRREHAPPNWLTSFVDFCQTEVPFYRRRAQPNQSFAALPSLTRGELTAKIWDFVPDPQPLDNLIVFSSSGTTGHPAQIPSHPSTAACGVPLLERALASTGIALPRGAEQMALAHIANYKGAYTTAIVVAYLQEAGCIRVNLEPSAWRSADDCPAFLDAWRAPVMLGDPLAFAALERVPLEHPPRAMISCIMHLSDALEAKLRATYGCEVLDIYALTEAGIVSVKTPRGHEVLPHDLYVEVLDDHDQPCPVGVRGEVTLTGGRNPFLPLLRYRTGDFASLAWDDGRQYLVELEGRAPVEFRVAGDRVVHSMEVTRLLRRFPLAQYQLHQDDAGGFQFRYRGGADQSEMRDALQALLGGQTALAIEQLAAPLTGPKVRVYHSALAERR